MCCLKVTSKLLLSAEKSQQCCVAGFNYETGIVLKIERLEIFIRLLQAKSG